MANPERSSFNCPSCGASVRITPGRNSMYCSFCGQPIIDVRKIVEQQAVLEVRKEEMAAIRGHKAEMLEMDLSHERKRAGAEIRNKFVSGFGGVFGSIIGKVLGAILSLFLLLVVGPYLLSFILVILDAIF